jgi:hypothetical protein
MAITASQEAVLRGFLTKLLIPDPNDMRAERERNGGVDDSPCEVFRQGKEDGRMDGREELAREILGIIDP